MTREEAIEQFMLAFHHAIENDQAVLAARSALHCHGLKLEHISFSADLSFRTAPPAANDEEFLRRLRIAPDLEVRE